VPARRGKNHHGRQYAAEGNTKKAGKKDKKNVQQVNYCMIAFRGWSRLSGWRWKQRVALRDGVKGTQWEEKKRFSIQFTPPKLLREKIKG
jgi:hypothetical protein